MTTEEIKRDCESKLNLFKICMLPWTTPRNIWNNIRHFFKAFKYAWQRAIRGYSDYDVYDLDTHLTHLFSAALIHLADTSNGYPGQYMFDTYDKWQKYLYDLAEKFYASSETNDYYVNEYEDEWYEEVKSHSITHYDETSEIAKKYFNKENEILELRQEKFLEAWGEMGNIFPCLWD